MLTKVGKLFFVNYLIWFIPSLIIMVLTVIIFFILIGASPDGFSSGKKDPFAKWPKGLIGALGIQYLLAGVVVCTLPLFIGQVDLEGWIYIVATALVCFLLAYWGITYDLKRLKRMDANP
ncbi:MAG: hypothetical protein R2780_08620 [Crocinitomicaceae bacterium]